MEEPTEPQAPIDEKKLEKTVSKALKKMKKEQKKVSINKTLTSIAISILIVILIIGGFVYYIHNSKYQLLEKGRILGLCYFPAGLSCQDSMVLDNGFSLKLFNGYPTTVELKEIRAGDCYSYPNITLDNAEVQWFNLTGCDLTQVFNEELIVNYVNPESGLTHKVSGKIQTTLSSDESSKFLERVNNEYRYIVNWFKNQFRK